MSINEARITVVKVAEVGTIPSCDVLTVLNEFREPRHEEFSEPTKWRLYNSVEPIYTDYWENCFR